jgi:hypothetical protein
VTVLVPCVAPKRLPLIVTGVPAVSEVGEILMMIGAAVFVNVTPMLRKPLTTTTTGPVPAPAGTGTAIAPVLQLVGVAAVPSKVTVLVPCVEPKFVPLIVTDVPTTPEAGDRLVMPGSTVKLIPLLFTPLAYTTTLPAVAPAGTVTTIDVALQLATIVVAVPLNVTAPVPWLAPKFVPVIVTDAPTAPDGGERLVMFGVSNTVNVAPLLGTPLTLTTTGPVVAPDGTGTTICVAFQVCGAAVVPLKATAP